LCLATGQFQVDHGGHRSEHYYYACQVFKPDVAEMLGNSNIRPRGKILMTVHCNLCKKFNLRPKTSNKIYDIAMDVKIKC